MHSNSVLEVALRCQQESLLQQPQQFMFDDLTMAERKTLAHALSRTERAELIALALVGSGVVAAQSWGVTTECLMDLNEEAASSLLVVGQDLDRRIETGLTKLNRLGLSLRSLAIAERQELTPVAQTA